MEDLLKLTVEDRILIYGLIPQESDYETLRDFKKLEDELKFNEDETRRFDISQVKDEASGLAHVTFNKEVTEGHLKDINFPARANAAVVEKLHKLSNDKKLTYQYLPLYEKFCVGEINASSTPSSKGKGTK